MNNQFNDRIEKLSTELDELWSNIDYYDLDDCYDNIRQNNPQQRDISIFAENQNSKEILETLMDLCYKLKSPTKVLNVLKNGLSPISFDWDNI